ncbi:hypothetical protein [Nocardioides alpinus]|uniref:hypothetical protein n=1 Tax=Nocardioides alpinus TaxID=748909 RepID=UPI0011140774|nr:hypothetical protein [Nocardioides alpinus]
MDERRDACLAAPEVLRRWVEKGTAYRFEHSGRPESLVALAMNALSLASSQGADWWTERIESLSLESVSSELLEGRIPDMSPSAARFAHELLETNVGRLRDAVRNR